MLYQAKTTTQSLHQSVCAEVLRKSCISAKRRDVLIKIIKMLFSAKNVWALDKSSINSLSFAFMSILIIFRIKSRPLRL